MIPFIPLALINVADGLNLAFNRLNNNWKRNISIYILISSVVVCFYINNYDVLIPREEVQDDFYKKYDDYLKFNDSNLYRTNTTSVNPVYTNKVGNIREYKTTMYISLFNNDYNYAYNNVFKNPLIKDKLFFISSNNILFQMYMGEKYIITPNTYDRLYNKINQVEDINIYRNDYVLPIGYTTNNKISEADFDMLSFPDDVVNMIGSVITENETNKTIIKSKKLTKEDFKVENTFNLEYTRKDDNYEVIADDNAIMKIKLNRELTEDELLFISFNIDEGEKNLSISINNERNVITRNSSIYKNEHTYFTYYLLDGNLDIIFNRGKFIISNIESCIIDLNYLKSINKTVTPFMIDQEQTKGDSIIGNIDVVEDNSYFLLSIPYDKGFTIFVDNHITPYQRANKSFIGFEIPRGNHNIKIIYEAPYKKIGIISSIIGIIMFISLIVYENKKSKNNK